MAQIDDRVLDLLGPLFRSSMAGLADLAIQRLNAAEDDPASEGEEQDPFAPQAEEDDRGRAMRQLSLVDEVVAGVLQRELILLERMQKLRRDLDEQLAGDSRDGTERLATILVMAPDPARDETRPEDLLTGARREPLKALLQAWEQGVLATRARIEADGD